MASGKPGPCLLLAIILFFRTAATMTTPTADNGQQQQKQTEDEQNWQFIQSLRLRALQNLQRSLESLSSLTANSLMLSAALQPGENELGEDDPLEEAQDLEQEEEHGLDGGNQPNDQSPLIDGLDLIPGSQQQRPPTQSQRSSRPSAGVRPHEQNGAAGIRRIRADLKQIPSALEGSDEPMTTMSPAALTAGELTTGTVVGGGRQRPHLQRRMRSAGTAASNGGAGRHQHGHHHQQQHGNGQQHGRRRRKGCPPVHGKDQLLCPTRNSHRYDVCITREQLCDRVRDCPGGEDEDSRHCFFYRPLETSLKTISHAVLLLVDTVMREEEQLQQQRRNEL